MRSQYIRDNYSLWSLTITDLDCSLCCTSYTWQEDWLLPFLPWPALSPVHTTPNPMNSAEPHATTCTLTVWVTYTHLVSSPQLAHRSCTKGKQVQMYTSSIHAHWSYLKVPSKLFTVSTELCKALELSPHFQGDSLVGWNSTCRRSSCCDATGSYRRAWIRGYTRP